MECGVDLGKSSPYRSALREASSSSGPLAGLRVVEFAALGPGPFAGMMLSDMGADVVTLTRGEGPHDVEGVMMRGRRQVVVDLKNPDVVGGVLDLLASAHALIEGYRPGVMERLGFAPDVVKARNKRLVYARMTGWGQTGPLANAAGHDINYISLSGALHAVGPKDRPVPPLNLVGDYGGGALYLVVGILAALLEAQKSGEGQVIDCAMCDGSASLMSLFCELSANGRWNHARESNMLDGGAHFYSTYECSDGQFISLGSIEPHFYAELCRILGLSNLVRENRMAKDKWPDMKAELTEVFMTRSRAEWCEVLEGTDVCFAPVLSLLEAPFHPHMAERNVFVKRGNIVQPSPAPRFSRTPSAIQASLTTDLESAKLDWTHARYEPWNGK